MDIILRSSLQREQKDHMKVFGGAGYGTSRSCDRQHEEKRMESHEITDWYFLSNI